MSASEISLSPGERDIYSEFTESSTAQNKWDTWTTVQNHFTQDIQFNIYITILQQGLI